MKYRECRASVKAAATEDGTFEAIVSVFGNEDSYGDVVMAGAFTDTLAEWKASGNPIPVIWSHDWSDPYSHIGTVLEAKELLPGDALLTEALKANGGLWTKGLLDLANPKAEQVYRLLKSGRVTQFSFAYDVLDGGWGTLDGRDVFELRKLALFEVGPTLIGANQATDLLAVKAAQAAIAVKEGRVLAGKHLDRLREAHAALGEVIDAAASTEDDGSKSSAPSGSESTKEPEGQPSAGANGDGSQAAPSARPKRLSPASARALVIATELLEGE